MSHRTGSLRAFVAISVMLLAAVAGPAAAQTMYPSFQQSRVVPREFNFAVADGRGITPIVFQWREGTTPRTQLSLDAGLADPEGTDTDVMLLVGGQYAIMLAQARADFPLDILLTAGVNGAFGNGTYVNVPVGVSVGHRFPLEGTAMAITPYVHPRLALEFASGDGDNSDIANSFDLGGNLELTPQLALRVSAMFGGDGLLGNDGDAIGISLAWSPRGLRATSPSR